MSTRSVRSMRSSRSESSRRLPSARLEEQLVKRRQAEHDRMNFWNNNATYFKAWDFNTNQHSNWTSSDFYQVSLENQKKDMEKKKRKEKLEERRRLLAIFLKKEEKMYKDELDSLQRRDELPLDKLKAANMEMLLRDEEKRRKEKELKMYHHWRQNEPVVREFERKQHYDFVRRSWLQQVLEKRKEREEEEKKVQLHLEELKKMEEERTEREKELIEERRKTEEELKAYLEKQMEIVKCREEREKILKQEELVALKEQKEVEEFLEERRKKEERRNREDLNLFHRRQYQLILKKRAQDVQENIDVDRKILERVVKDMQNLSEEESKRSAKFRREVELAREAFRKQAEIEKLRTKQTEFLFYEEAKKMYEKQEVQWKLESEARDRLMKDVLGMLEVQIQEKLVENLALQEEIRKDREATLKRMEEANNRLKEHKKKTEETVAGWKNDLGNQVLEKQLKAIYEKKKREEDKENELKATKEEEERLYRELSKMNILGFRPKQFGRKNLIAPR